MLKEAIVISLQITAIYVIFMEGSILGWFRIAVANILDRLFGKIASIYIQKPLWECLFCMSSIWTIILTWRIDVRLILTVCGINFLINKFIESEGIS